MFSIVAILAFAFSFDQASAWISSHSGSTRGLRCQFNLVEPTFARHHEPSRLSFKLRYHWHLRPRYNMLTSLRSSSKPSDGAAVNQLSTSNEVEASVDEYNLR
jgi:hypothetical protein